jgi:hypothetical protein
MPLQSNVFLSNHHYLYDSSSFFMNEKLQRNLSRKGSPRGGGGGGEKKIHSNLSHLCDKEAIVASASPRGISFALQTLMILCGGHVHVGCAVIMIVYMSPFSDRFLQKL